MAAAAVVSVSMGVMKPVLAKLTSLMGDEYKKFKDLRKEVTFLQSELADMDALLEKMDSADELDPQAKKWRKDIIEMSYNIEDCIDDFMQHVGEADDKMSILRKASQYLRTFKDRRHLANQFQGIKAQVMEASERRKRYMLDQSISIIAPVAIDPRLSAIYKESASLVGIDAQKTELINRTMDKGQQLLKVMAIVGLGGLGKTTLANEVCREVGGKFDCKDFVSVSQKPEMVGLFNSLLLQLGLRPYSHACQVQDPINDLRGHLQDKRYFILVDDLWDTKAWDTIKCAFPQNNKYSRVMITTRNENLARSCCGNHEGIHNMRPLNEQDSKKLFFDRIFGSEYACPPELKKASVEVLKKCDGLPLAIITMARMLACQPTRLEGQWEYIQNSLATKFAINSNYEDMMHILDLSYKNLPRHLKACFLYLGSYPEDHEISRIDLVRRWVAEGFVSNCARQDIWDVPESYFNELVNRSMIRPTYDRYNILILGCRVHDMLLELIARRCKEDNFLSLVNGPQAVVEAQDKVIRRLNVVGLQGIEKDKVTITTGVNLAQIRSFTILGGSNWIPPLLEFKIVRVLSLDLISFGGHEMAMDLTVINQLSQLRYLKVEGDGSNIMLPWHIRGLRLLETLDLSRKFNHSFSLEIVDVPRLSHLVMPRGTRLPDWISKVKSLRTLRSFSLPIDSLEGIIGLGELNALKELNLNFPTGRAGLSKAAWMTALSASLDKLGNLKELGVHPCDFLKPIALCADALSSLSPAFHNLERLELQHVFTFSRVPRWIGHLHNLRDLWLGAKQVLREDVAIIRTRLTSLIRFSLRIPGVLSERITVQGSTGYLALKWFRFDCDWMSLLEFEAGAMPALQELELTLDADEWDKAAPSGLQHLRSLEKITTWETFNASERRSLKATTDDEDGKNAEVALIRSMFHKAADALATRPALIFKQPLITRPVEEEDYSSEDD
ncbi:unnamed protein product [Urochloa decumbens]|uniref:Uncharacterized protein n=2 Tax=Urochloa decumbens TaxID=240449 RepID=A0ABC9C1T5_9POAL